MTESDRVEMAFSLTLRDVIDGYTAVGTATRPSVRRRRVLGGVVTVAAVIFGIAGMPWVLAGAVVFLGLLNMVPMSVLYRPTARRAMRDNPRWGQQMVFHLGENGVDARGGDFASRLDWGTFPFYLETGSAFLMLASNGPRTTFQVLPRRALADPRDTARLADLLARHCRRMEPRTGWFRRPAPAAAPVPGPASATAAAGPADSAG